MDYYYATCLLMTTTKTEHARIKMIYKMLKSIGMHDETILKHVIDDLKSRRQQVDDYREKLRRAI